MAGFAHRAARACQLCRAVHAGEELFHNLRVARAALLRPDASRCLRVVRRPVAAFTGIGPQRAVHACRHIRRFVRVAVRTDDFCDARGMRVLLDIRMAGSARKDRVDTGLVLCGIYIKAAPRVGLQVLIAVASKTVRIRVNGGFGLGTARDSQEKQERGNRRR